MSVIGAAAALLLVGCGGTSSVPGPQANSASLRVLSASAVPGVPYTTSVLTVADLLKDASVPGLASNLSSWGYVAGAQRTFQGESRHLTYVLSRELLFKDAYGASAYVAYVYTNSTAYFGVAATQPLVAQGRPGWQFVPAACACHLANPVVAGVVSSQSHVVWLEINGPEATPALLASLLDPSNSVETTA